MTNRKTAYVDFSKPEYSSLSDEEVQKLKTMNTKGNRKNLRNCKEHGLCEPVFVKSYDKNYRETNFYSCPKCLTNFGGNNDKS